MKFLFLIGSSVKHFEEKHLSAYNEQQRFEQTLKTIESVREKVKNSYIVLFEASSSPIEDKYRKIFQDKCDLVLELYDDLAIKQIYENLKKDPKLFTYGKSILETRAFLNTLYTVQKHNLFSDSQRIFKLTGRYFLNDDFDIKDYESKFFENKYVIKKYDYTVEESSSYNNEDLSNVYAYLYGANGMMVTGLWSFDRNLFSEIVISLEKAFSYMEKMIQYTAGNDIEHSLYRYLNKKNIVDIPNLGLTVIKGMEGVTYDI